MSARIRRYRSYSKAREADLYKRLAQLTALQETGRAVVSTLDLNALLELIIQQAVRLLRAEGGMLNLVDWKNQEDEVLACAGIANGTLGYKIPLDQTLSGWVTLHRQPQISNRVLEDPRAYRRGVQALFQKPLLNAAAAPLMIQERVIGSLVVVNKQQGAADFEPDDLELLVGFANQAATAIENARLYRAEQRRAEQFRVIGEVGRQILTVTKVDELLPQMAQLTQEAFDYDQVGIGLVDGDRIVSKAQSGGCGAGDPERTMPFERDNWSWVVQHGKPLVQADAWGDRRSPATPGMEAIRSWICVPIWTKDAVIGVLSAASSRVNAFDASDQMALQALAQQAAVAIENIRFHEQAQQLAVLEERNRLARELHDAVTQTLFSATLIAESIPSVWKKDPVQGLEMLQELHGLNRGALAEMRTLLFELRPAVLVDTSLEELLRQLGEAASGREGIPVEVVVEGKVRLPSDVHVSLYRIAQEALNNVVKHARARRVTVRLCSLCPEEPAGRSVQLSIVDDGCGFIPAHPPHHHLGLGIMRERALAIGADLTIDSQPGKGTRVSVWWEQGGEEYG